MPNEPVHELDEHGRPVMSTGDREIEIEKLTNKLEKWGLKGVFGGGGLALLSEPLNNNGVNTTITNTCLTAGTIIMIAGCIALILSERKKQPSTVHNDNGDELRF